MLNLNGCISHQFSKEFLKNVDLGLGIEKTHVKDFYSSILDYLILAELKDNDPIEVVVQKGHITIVRRKK